MSMEMPMLTKNEDENSKKEEKSEFVTYLEVAKKAITNPENLNVINELYDLPKNLKIIAEKYFNEHTYSPLEILNIVNAQKEIDNLDPDELKDIKSKIHPNIGFKNPEAELLCIKIYKEIIKIPNEFEHLKTIIETGFFHKNIDMEIVLGFLKKISEYPSDKKNSIYEKLDRVEGDILYALQQVMSAVDKEE